ncbi:prepilin-type N-terminal cleavage/methylation domain-containing protein [Candidatus Woesebacteria bacterium]|nr:prepilin-type N-terminal cleavage/methylation domain-containing protein [Candidatus Woesebacteria bacterium]
MKRKIKFGFSLIEMLVVIAVFSVLVVLIAQGLTGSLRSTKKSESEISVKENLDFAISVMERQLHNAKAVDIASCGGTTLNYTDQYDNATSFSCVLPSGSTSSYLASGSAHLTNSYRDINTKCTQDIFTCSAGGVGVNDQPSVTITLSGKTVNATDVTGSTVTDVTKIFLRTY